MQAVKAYLSLKKQFRVGSNLGDIELVDLNQSETYNKQVLDKDMK